MHRDVERRLRDVMFKQAEAKGRALEAQEEMRQMLAETWTEFRQSKELEVAIFTGTGRGFCAGEDMKESLQKGKPGGQRPAIEDPFMSGALEKPNSLSCAATWAA